MNIDVERLKHDREYWDQVAPDDFATHYCKKYGGFEYLEYGYPGCEFCIKRPRRKA